MIRPEHKHLFKLVTKSGFYPFVLDAMQARRITALNLACDGPGFTGSEWGRIYFWQRDAKHFTHYLILTPGGPHQLPVVFGDHGLVLEAGEEYCLAYEALGWKTGRYIFGDILHVPA